MPDLLAQLAPYGLIFAAVVCVGLLFRLSRLHPFVAMTIGAVLLAVPVAQWLTFDRRFFHSDGSAAGLVIFAAYAIAGFACAFLGVVIIMRGIAPAARPDGTPLPSRKLRFAFLGFVGLFLLALQFYRFYLHDHLAALSARADRQNPDRLIDRTVEVRDFHALVWKARGGAPEFRLTLPAADLARRAREPVATIGVTPDGPIAVELVLPVAEATRGALTLHRDGLSVDEEVLSWLDQSFPSLLPDAPAAFWVERESKGGWTLLGMDCAEGTAARYPDLAAVGCHVPDNLLARRFPRLFGLERVRVHSVVDREYRSCVMSFRYRERVVSVRGGAACWGKPGVAAFVGSVKVLDRLARDSESPPGADVRAKRLAEAVATCEQAGKAVRAARDDYRATREAEARQETVCDYALRLAASQPKTASDEANLLVLRILEVPGDSGGRAQLPQIDQVLEALAAAGKGESREALWAHVLRLERIGGSTAEEDKRKARASAEPLFALAPKVLVPDDPLFDRIARLGPRESTDPAFAAYLAMQRARLEKAEAAAAGSDTALKARYDLCTRRMHANAERETLGDCAATLLAAWRERAAKGVAFTFITDGEAGLANAISAMYSIDAHVTGEFRAGLEALHRVHAFAAQRLASLPGTEGLFGEFARREADLTQKAQAAPRRR